MASTTGLAAALAAAQAEMPSVGKDGTNPHFRNKFVTLDNLIEKTRPVLNKHGLAIMQFPSVSEIGAPTLTTRIVHESGEFVETAMPLFLGKQDMQAFGSSITYARRYAWAAALGIASDEDDDGNQASAQTAAPEQPTTRPAANGTITEPQQKRLFAIAKEAGVEAVEVKRLVLEVAGVDSTAEVPKGKYDELVEAIQGAGVPF